MALFENNIIKDVYGISEMIAEGCETVNDPFEALRQETMECTKCPLHSTRKNVVFGVGNNKADLMFVGEGPGADEDEQGIPFVGRAGQLLTKMIEAMGLSREKVYIANIVKCRPPENRNPFENESMTCIPFLYRQIEYIKPKVIICLGSVATQNLLRTNVGITKLRGEFVDLNGIKVMPTYHPAYLLRNPNMKKPCWEDLQTVMKEMGLK
jgi:DNA polymerase